MARIVVSHSTYIDGLIDKLKILSKEKQVKTITPGRIAQTKGKTEKLNFKVTTTSDYGLSPDCIEAVTFAWLAKKRLENQPSNIPTVTGATERVVLGGIYSPIKKNS